MKRVLLVLLPVLFTNFIIKAQQIGTGYAPVLEDFNAVLQSGVYTGSSPNGSIPGGGWQHLLVVRHGNPNNNNQLQLGSSISSDDKLFFRKLSFGDLSSGNPAWYELATRGENTFNGTQIFNSNVGIGTPSPKSQLHLASDADHSFLISRADGTYGFRIFRNAQAGNVYFQIGSSSNVWETKIQIGEGEGVNTKLLFNPNGGNVGIGTTNPQNKLDVNGTIRAKEVKVETGWADFVFTPTYKLRPLSEVEQFIKTNGHLPEIPKAEDVQQNGVNLGDMQTKLLQKVEELTLYSIEQEKANAALQQQLAIQAQENLELKQEMKELKKLLMEKLK
jgi:hypothetical protein